MIVDLLRNDLGRICLPGSVKVKKLFEVEKYETLLQMTSTVTGKLQTGIKIFDMVKSLFPCGSVTGAPKIQSMKSSERWKRAEGCLHGRHWFFCPGRTGCF